MHGVPAEPLVDSYGRRIEYLRVSVLDRCNLHCFYCRPRSRVEKRTRCRPLSAADVARLVEAFVDLGVSRVRLTGGEPLLRRDIGALAERIAALPALQDLSLSTNGYLLARHAQRLRAAGVTRVNVSLDTLDPIAFAAITRGGELRHVLEGIDAAIATGLRPIKLNMVVMRGINDHEIPHMLDFARTRGLELRFIETMPLGSSGAEAMKHHLPAQEIMQRVRGHVGEALIPVLSDAGGGPARCYRIGNSPCKVGVISAVSRHFCASCNRVRLSSNGDLLLCLGRSHRRALAPLLDADDPRAALEEAIRASIARKPWSHDFARAGAVADTEMSQVGG